MILASEMFFNTNTNLLMYSIKISNSVILIFSSQTLSASRIVDFRAKMISVLYPPCAVFPLMASLHYSQQLPWKMVDGLNSL